MNNEDYQNIMNEIQLEERMKKEKDNVTPTTDSKDNKNSKIKNGQIIDKDIAFNHLKDLQVLLKKESALKELFIQTSNDTKKNIEDQCREIYKKKLDVFLHLKKLNKNETLDENIKKFELVEFFDVSPKFDLFIAITLDLPFLKFLLLKLLLYLLVELF